MSFEIVEIFESKIADYFGAPYAVATDCCTHAIELCLRFKNITRTTIPKHTYLSIPMTLNKLNLDWNFNNEEWTEYYELKGTNIYDAAVLWRENSYIPGSLMCLSFQYQKHLSLGRAGMILCDDFDTAQQLIGLSYDGRKRHIPWKDQKDIKFGYHYYMTPEIAQQGLAKLQHATNTEPKLWTWREYPDLSQLEIFNDI